MSYKVQRRSATGEEVPAIPLTCCVTLSESFLFCASASPSVIGADINPLLGEALVCKTRVWLSHAFSLYSKSFLNHSIWLIRFYVSPNIFKRNVSLCPAAVLYRSSFHRQPGLLLSATLGCWNLAPHTALWCGIGTRRMLPPAMHRVKPGSEMSRQGQDGFHGSCAAAAASSSLFPSCSNYCSSAQFNNCTSKPSEQMNSGPRANLSQWSFATDFKWDWDLALQPSPVFPLFTHSCATHV